MKEFLLRYRLLCALLVGALLTSIPYLLSLWSEKEAWEFAHVWYPGLLLIHPLYPGGKESGTIGANHWLEIAMVVSGVVYSGTAYFFLCRAIREQKTQ